MQTPYRHILVAIDLSAHSIALMAKAHKIANIMQTKATFLHVIEPSLESEHIFVDPQEYKTIAKKEAHKKLSELFKSAEITDVNLLIEFGDTKKIILNTAKKLDIDLIVVGSHGHQGLHFLLGSIANAIVHTAHCDVDVVRLVK